MKPTLDDVLRGLEEASTFAKSYRFELTEDYLQLIAQVEAMPRNQSGADKSYVWRGQRTFLESFKNVRLLPRKP